MHRKFSLVKFETDNREDVDAMCAFIRAISKAFEADYAVAHILTRAELNDRLDLLRKRTEKGMPLYLTVISC
jgi:hypothetical protein